MIQAYYDLHIHSCLSPCGDDEMTPANIIGMAFIKGLNIIALTDHNSCKNCPAIMELAKEYGVIVVPGMELCTSEEVHVVCLFPTLEKAMAFDSYVTSQSIPFPNNADIFGKQQIYNAQDEICGEETNLLINATNISIDSVWDLVSSYDGVMLPAHIDKSSNSLLFNLGFIPPTSQFRSFELADLSTLHKVRESNPYLEDCHVLCNSDAHYLDKIHEASYSILLEELTPTALINYLRQTAEV